MAPKADRAGPMVSRYAALAGLDQAAVAIVAMHLGNGASAVAISGGRSVVLTAVGAYQLGQALRASARLTERGVAHAANYMLEPGRFRAPRGSREAAHMSPDAVRDRLYPPSTPARMFLTHMRPEALLGSIHPVCTGPRTVGLGFTNHGGTLDTDGMLFANAVTWAHALDAVARLLAMDRSALLTKAERAALDGQASPQGVLI